MTACILINAVSSQSDLDCANNVGNEKGHFTSLQKGHIAHETSVGT